MNYTTLIGFLSVATAALLTFVATAMATTVTGPSGEATPVIHLVNENGHLKITSNFVAECDLTAEGAIASHGSGKAASTNLTHLSWPGCTNWHMTTGWSGILSIDYVSPGIGTLTSTGMTVTTTRFPVICSYATNNTYIGQITDSSITGGGATIHVKADLPVHNSSPLCGTTNRMEGTLVSTSELFIDP